MSQSSTLHRKAAAFLVVSVLLGALLLALAPAAFASGPSYSTGFETSEGFVLGPISPAGGPT